MEIVEIITERVLELEDGSLEIIAVAAQGPPGSPGAAASTLQIQAGEALGGHRMVVPNEVGQAVYANSGNPAHANKVLGMTVGAAVMGAQATIQTGGDITEPSWAWTPGAPIYLGQNGLLTQAPPTAGFSLIVGFPMTANRVFLNAGQVINLI